MKKQFVTYFVFVSFIFSVSVMADIMKRPPSSFSYACGCTSNESDKNCKATSASSGGNYQADGSMIFAGDWNVKPSECSSHSITPILTLSPGGKSISGADVTATYNKNSQNTTGYVYTISSMEKVGHLPITIVTNINIQGIDKTETHWWCFTKKWEWKICTSVSDDDFSGFAECRATFPANCDFE